MITTLILFVIAIISVYFYIFKWKFKYWERHGIPHSKPVFPFGTIRIGDKLHLAQQMHQQYLKFKEKGPIFGGYRLLEPLLIIADPQIAKQILIKDFSSFHSRGLYENRKDDPMVSHLFILSGQQWKRIREKVTPVFTSGKIRGMTPTILAIAERLVDKISSEIKIDSQIDVKEWLARFTTDVIGSCAFGLECNSIADPDAEFRKMGKILLKNVNFVKVFFGQNFPWFSKNILHLTILTDQIRNFFFNTVKQNVAYRQKNGSQRNDFLDLLIGLYNEKKTNDEKDWDLEGLSIYEIAAQCFVFFFAGFETSSSAISYTLLELARNQDIQKEARKHVKEVLKKHNGEMTYEMLQDLTYIDQCVFETLRMYPLAPMLLRVANENYRIPNTNYVIPKGQSVNIPIYSYQLDPDHFPDPEKYDPTRFASKESQHTQIYMPFGEGQRICIGERFAKMTVKLALALLLMNFEFEFTPKTNYPPIYNTRLPLMSTKGEMFLGLKRL
ncbi:probable cytochrome P450 6a14 [Culicoides brevitarsis]|uniref:probable cytochrome P450 6a14 n=1 Tax=Culicoides brevitarsis TaxID=469753 RepID=UPI00307C829C